MCKVKGLGQSLLSNVSKNKINKSQGIMISRKSIKTEIVVTNNANSHKYAPVFPTWGRWNTRSFI